MIPSVVALIFDQKERLLVVRLGGHRNELWGLPGGRIELDETPEDALMREVMEEIGVRVKVDSLHGVYAGEGFRLTYPNGDQGAYVMIAYRCTIIGGDISVDDDEVTDARYVRDDELDDLQTASWGKIVMPDAFRANKL